MKVCSKCKVEKELSEFGKVKNNINSRCKSCNNEMAKNFRSNNKEKIKKEKKEYYEKNKEKILQQKKKYYDDNIEKILEYQKKYRTENVEIVTEYQKKYRIENKEKIKECNNKYYKKNIDKINENKKKYLEKNKDKINKKKNIKEKERMKKDPIYALKKIIKSAINGSIKRNGYRKKSRSQEVLGCSLEYFKVHIESQMLHWMTWENRGLYNGELSHGWDLDHIIPLSSALTEEDLIRLNHYTNFQPLCSRINRDIKKNRLEY